MAALPSCGGGEQLGINPETLRNWLTQAEIDEGHRPGTKSEETRRITELEREVTELRRANEILRTASAFFAAAKLAERSSGPRRTDVGGLRIAVAWTADGAAAPARILHSRRPEGAAEARSCSSEACSQPWT